MTTHQTNLSVGDLHQRQAGLWGKNFLPLLSAKEPPTFYIYFWTLTDKA